MLEATAMAIVQTARATPIMISRRPCHDLARWRSSPNSVRDLGRARIHSPRSSTGRELGHHIGRRWRLRLRHSPGCEAESEHRRRRSSGSARASTSTRVNSRITAVARLRLLSRDGDVAAVQAGELASQGERQARLPRPCRARSAQTAQRRHPPLRRHADPYRLRARYRCDRGLCAASA